MKLFFWRRKPKPPPASVADMPESTSRLRAAQPARTAATTLSRAPAHRQVADPTLRFAYDYLAAAGARVRFDDDGTLIAQSSDGAERRYTTDTARAREDERLELLASGGDALGGMLDDAASRTRLFGLRLPAGCDPVALVREMLAEPAAGCSACVSEMSSELCEQCPLRHGRVVVQGFGQIRGVGELGRDTPRAVELTYVISGAYRNGRLDDCLRLAFDERTGDVLPALTEDQIAQAQAQPIALGSSDLRRSSERARALAHPALEALGLFLRLRSLEDYSRLHDELRQTRTRLLKEDPASAHATEDAYTHELERLTEVFAVNVTARIESVCVVESEVARLAVRSAAGAELSLDVDLGRRMVMPPRCPGCGTPATALVVRGKGSFACPSCRTSSAHAVQKASRPDPECATPPDVLTVAHLDAMGPLTWRAFLQWLLERDGRIVDPPAAAPSGIDATVAARLHLRARRGEQQVAVLALRQSSPQTIAKADVRDAAALGMSPAKGERLLIETSSASPDARAEAARLGVQLMDRVALADWLAEQAVAYASEREQAQRDARDRAGEACRVRETAVQLIQDVESALAAALNQQRASGGAEVAAAAAIVADIRQTAERLFVAWDTFLSDWSLSFDDRPDRDGHLVIAADMQALTALAERADHLGHATVESLARIAETPAEGELGYSAWRRAVLEELTARCESVRWRLLALDPAHWLEFSACHDAQAQEQAATAVTAAAHASARVASSYARLRARVPVG